MLTEIPVIVQPPWWQEALKIFAGFLFGLALFYVQEKVRARNSKKQTKNYCLKEIDHNIDILRQCKEVTKRLKEELSVGKTNLYFDFKSSSILYKFTHDAFASGLLFDRLSSEDISKLNNDLIGFFQPDLDTFISNKLRDYTAQKISQDEAYGAVNWVEDKAKEDIKLLKSIKSKLS